MRLSAEIYDQIIAGLKSDDGRDKDKRREPRVGLAGEADYVTVGEDGKRQAGTLKVRDVSRSGIGLLSNHQIPSQQRFVIQLASSNREPIWLVCTVAYCRKVEMGRFSVGAKILQVLRAKDIEKVEAKAAAAMKPSVARQAAKAPEGEDVMIARISKAILG